MLGSSAGSGSPRTGRLWRGLVYLVSTVPMVAAAAPLLVPVLPWVLLAARTTADRPVSFGVVVSLGLVGAALTVTAGPLAAMPLAALERRRLSLLDAAPALSGHRTPPAPGFVPWLRTRYTEAATWRELGYALLLVTLVPVVYVAVTAVVGLVGLTIAVPFLVGGATPVSLGVVQLTTVAQAVPYAVGGLALLPVVLWMVVLLAVAHAKTARALVTARHRDLLRAELVDVTRSRARVVDAFDAERRRIERDLHDGAQQRLVSLTMQLGLARIDLPPGSPAAEAVAGAHQQAKLLMTELRELIHGIYPRALTDLGLAEALRGLAAQAAVPVTVDVELPERPPPPVETTAYFVVAEALANAGKHSGATAAAVRVRLHGGTLAVEVTDDGRGGADPGGGTGLTGLADRAAATGGRMWLASPAGGPTLLRVELPCRPHRPSG